MSSNQINNKEVGALQAVYIYKHDEDFYFEGPQTAELVMTLNSDI